VDKEENGDNLRKKGKTGMLCAGKQKKTSNGRSKNQRKK
jgi:hypothetical protein